SCNGFTGNASSFSSSYSDFLRRYWEAQGWIQWTWMAENADEWSYEAGLKHGRIPQNPTDLQHPNIC
ncbi:hypothetical protein BDQ17DRAFT_1175069, partial [Cyathus striatus]